MVLKQQLWTCSILMGFFQLTQSATLRCYYKNTTLDDYEEVNLSDGKTLLSKDCYNSTYKNFFYIFGNNGKPNGTATTSVLRQAVTLTGFNVFLVNWAKETASIEIVKSQNTTNQEVSYVFKSVPEAFAVGTDFGKTLMNMSEAGLNLANTIVAAHSLGAHLAAQAGRTVKALKKSIQCIIGLDSAGPLFGEPPILPALASDCANFTYTVHTDPGDYGINKSETHVDIFVNYAAFLLPDEKDQVQLGCPIGMFEKFTTDDLCSHNRSWMLLIESMEYYHTLLASKTDTNCRDWLAGKGNFSDTVNIGLDIDQTKRGIYCMITNDAPPYGKGLDGTHP